MPRGAVLKANYVPTGKGSKAKIRASGCYYTNRPDRDGDRTYRTAFNKEGDTLSKEELSAHLERADVDHHYHYRMVLSPGAEAHTNGDLKAWTRDVMGEMELQHGGKSHLGGGRARPRRRPHRARPRSRHRLDRLDPTPRRTRRTEDRSDPELGKADGLPPRTGEGA